MTSITQENIDAISAVRGAQDSEAFIPTSAVQGNHRPRRRQHLPGRGIALRDLLDSVGQIVRMMVTVGIQQDLERHADMPEPAIQAPHQLNHRLFLVGA
ncbi:hypothetical protein [Bradyrhizobium oligotrophicum]|uniref:hypothetical protein n=1 Tax=Bradyrhizobium oligotrophicum TaxID=44255 RepID=UPI0013924400|nr:hypothetical protein [Bradyrhizobium oligotrophicum]